MTLRTRLLMAYSAAAALPVLLAALAGWGVATRATRRQLERDAAHAAEAIVRRLELGIGSIVRDVEMRGRSRNTWGATDSVVRQNRDVRRAILLDETGKPTMRIEWVGFRAGWEPVFEVEEQRFRDTDRDGMAAGMAAAPGRSKMVGWRADREVVLRYATRLAKAGETVGIALYDISLSELMSRVVDPLTAPALNLVVVRRDGTILWHADAARRWQTLAVREPDLNRVWPSIRASPAGLVQARLRGDETALGYHWDGGREWVVAATASYASALMPVRRVASWTLAGVGGLLLLSLLAVWRFSRRLASTMESLTDGAMAFAGGDLTHRVPERGTDEIGRLGASLNKMADDLARSQDRLREQERLAVLGELSAALAHEIKNPLHSIAASAETLHKRGDDPAIREKCVGFIEQEARRLNEFLMRFLQLGRPLHLDRRPTDLRALLRRAADIAQTRHGDGKDVRVVEEFSEQCPDVPVDEAQVLHAFLNLAFNAYEAMPHGGMLRLGIRCADGAAVIRIQDSGPGISETAQKRLFEPFVSHKPGGSGLGLAITRRILEAHGGSIEVSGAEGEGTTATVRLPREGVP